MDRMEWSIHDIARLTGTTSRTLRHHDAIGLLEPSRAGSNGYRWHDERALVRCSASAAREVGLGLPDIGEVLARAGRRRRSPCSAISLAAQEQDDWSGRSPRSRGRSPQGEGGNN